MDEADPIPPAPLQELLVLPTLAGEGRGEKLAAEGLGDFWDI